MRMFITKTATEQTTALKILNYGRKFSQQASVLKIKLSGLEKSWHSTEIYFRRELKTISRTHHATCAFRLSCGCIAEYNSFPEARQPTVLCGNCGESATIDYRYPDDSESCGVTTRTDRPDGGNVRVRCSKKPSHRGDHFD